MPYYLEFLLFNETLLTIIEFWLLFNLNLNWFSSQIFRLSFYDHWESPHDKMPKVLDCDLEVSKVKFKSCYYADFSTNTLSKGMNPLNPSVWIK